MELSVYEKMLVAYLEARCVKPVPEAEIIEVEAYEIKKYPVEFVYVPRKPGRWSSRPYGISRQIKLFPRVFMSDESNFIHSTKTGQIRDKIRTK